MRPLQRCVGRNPLAARCSVLLFLDALTRRDFESYARFLRLAGAALAAGFFDGSAAMLRRKASMRLMTRGSEAVAGPLILLLMSLSAFDPFRL